MASRGSENNEEIYSLRNRIRQAAIVAAVMVLLGGVAIYRQPSAVIAANGGNAIIGVNNFSTSNTQFWNTAGIGDLCRNQRGSGRLRRCRSDGLQPDRRRRAGPERRDGGVWVEHRRNGYRCPRRDVGLGVGCVRSVEQRGRRCLR